MAIFQRKSATDARVCCAAILSMATVLSVIWGCFHTDDTKGVVALFVGSLCAFAQCMAWSSAYMLTQKNAGSRAYLVLPGSIPFDSPVRVYNSHDLPGVEL